MIKTENGITTIKTKFPLDFANIPIFIKISSDTFQISPMVPRHVLRHIRDFETVLDMRAKTRIEVEKLHKDISRCRNTISEIEALEPSSVWPLPDRWLKMDKLEMPIAEDDWVNVELMAAYDIVTRTTCRARIKKGHLKHYIATQATARHLDKIRICRKLRRYSPPQSRAILLFEFQVYDVIKNAKKIEQYLEAHEAIEKLEMTLGHVTDNLSALGSSIGANIELFRSQR